MGREAGGVMEIRFYKNLYRGDLSDRKLASIKKKIRKRSVKLNLFLVTMPLGSQGILEIYWYPELLQPFYQKIDRELLVVGLAGSMDDAFLLITQIVQDAGIQDGRILLAELFKEKFE